ncbi:MAG: thioredoxin family protein [Bacteroidota bacterium]
MKYQVIIFGMGSQSDKILLKSVQMAAQELGLRIEVFEKRDISEFVEIGITSIPALAINEQIVSHGRVPSVSEIKGFFSQKKAA